MHHPGAHAATHIHEESKVSYSDDLALKLLPNLDIVGTLMQMRLRDTAMGVAVKPLSAPWARTLHLLLHLQLQHMLLHHHLLLVLLVLLLLLLHDDLRPRRRPNRATYL